VALTQGELYTIVTNKAKHGKKGALVAIVKGTRAEDVIKALQRIPDRIRRMTSEITADMSPSMEQIARTVFRAATLVTDRFHVQQLVSEAVQEVRMLYRREAIKKENGAIIEAKKTGAKYAPVRFENGDTEKELLARSVHLLFKPSSKWYPQQKERAAILFAQFPQLKHAYDLSMYFRNIYETATSREDAKEKFKLWRIKVSLSNLPSFQIPADTIEAREETILNYFHDRSTNASAESFNAKLKNFRAVLRGVRDKTFFLFRVAKLYG
jgi:transposase